MEVKSNYSSGRLMGGNKLYEVSATGRNPDGCQ
jgi:hypothetical protein